MADTQASVTPVTEPVSTSTLPPVTHTDFFGGSEDIFSNPAFVKADVDPVIKPELHMPDEDGSVTSDELEVANKVIEPIIEPVVQPVVASVPERLNPSFAEPEAVAPVFQPEIPSPAPFTSPIEEVAPVVETVVPVVEEPVHDAESEEIVTNPNPQVSSPEPFSSPIEEVPVVEDVVPMVEEPVEEEGSKEKIEEGVEEKIEEGEEEEKQEEQVLREKEPIADVSTSELTQKFMELFHMTKKVAELKKTEDGFTLLGADNDKVNITYKVFPGDEEYPMVSITKEETDKEQDEQSSHELSFYLDEQGTSLNVNLDDFLLFEERADLQDDVKKRMQVSDKLNKFTFLMSEEIRKLEKELKEKEAEEQEKKKLQDIFRNF